MISALVRFLPHISVLLPADGDYYPVTLVGRIIAIIMMLSGIGIFVLFVSTLAQRKLEWEESRLEQRRLFGHDTKNIIKKRIEEIEK
jgi:Ion channel